jgi:hypothetical protein
MRIFKYKTIRRSDPIELEELLIEYGALGWRVISHTTDLWENSIEVLIYNTVVMEMEKEVEPPKKEDDKII